MGRCRWIPVLALVVSLAGCGDQPTAPAAPRGLRGTVSSNGVPVIGARIYILPELVPVTPPGAAVGAPREGVARVAGVPPPDPAPDLLFVSPNPMSAICQVYFSVSSGDPRRLAIYDHWGRVVRTLADRTFPLGYHVMMWDGTDDRGVDLLSGAYTLEYRIAFAAAPVRLTTPVVKRIDDPFAPGDAVTDAHGAFALTDVSGSPGDTLTIVGLDGQRLGVQRLTDRMTIRAAVGDTPGTLRTAEWTVTLADVWRGRSIALLLP